MTKFWHGVLHVGAIALQVVNVSAPFVPPPYNAVVAAGLGLVQAVAAVVGHKNART